MSFLSKLASSVPALPLRGDVVLGVSGGADSVALLHGMASLPTVGGITVAHIDHQLRADSDHDARWVRALARRMNADFHLFCVDVTAEADRGGFGIEEAARNARYRKLVECAKSVGSRAVAVAHHRDDGVETVLHNIIRGTGLVGLSGMAPSRHVGDGVFLVRPLLSISRSEILEYLHQHGIEYLHDESNDDTSFTRNRIRHDLLPLLERDFNPKTRDALLRLAQQAGEVTDVLAAQVTALQARCCELTESEVRVRCDLLGETPRSIVRQLMRQVWIDQDWPRQKMGFAEWDSVAAIIAGELSGRDLPGGVNAARRRATLKLTRP